MISRSVSYPGEWASVVAEVTAVGKQTATSQDGVTTSVQFTRLHIDCSVCLQCISGSQPDVQCNREHVHRSAANLHFVHVAGR